MKKLASIIGAGVISMAVAFSPAFAQTPSQKPAAPTDSAKAKTEVKLKPPASAPASEVKTEKTAPAALGAKTTRKKSAGESKTLKSKKAMKGCSHAAVSRKHPVKKGKGKILSLKRSEKRSLGVEREKKAEKSEKSAPLSGK
ncbi:MAG: hypothetical protein P4L43_18895 [Syntrophobacteraceae bacterium]|nr:hypothetical protein [Syntrophobacteraceae bacterium]